MTGEGRKNMNERISVIVPVYNVEKYLPRCMDSILAQTYQNLEIILVDDGSSDECPKICDEYERRDERIRVIHKENGGLSDARNTGIDAANGEYLTFVDSDDYIHPEMYESLWGALKAEHAEVAMCNLKKVYQMDAEVSSVEEKEVKVYTGIQAIENILDKNLHVVSVVACGKLYKRKLFEDIRFPKGKLHEDEFTTYQIYYKSNQIVACSGAYYYYFQRENSIMGTRKTTFSYDGLEAYERMGEFFREKGCMDMMYLVKYKYLYMLKEAVCVLQKSEDLEERKAAALLAEKYRQEYRAYIYKIRGVKKKIKLSLYYCRMWR